MPGLLTNMPVVVAMDELSREGTGLADGQDNTIAKMREAAPTPSCQHSTGESVHPLRPVPHVYIPHSRLSNSTDEYSKMLSHCTDLLYIFLLLCPF